MFVCAFFFFLSGETKSREMWCIFITVLCVCCISFSFFFFPHLIVYVVDCKGVEIRNVVIILRKQLPRANEFTSG